VSTQQKEERKKKCKKAAVMVHTPLLSTRDWPTRIRTLDARMDRQKFNKMMERSDFMNLQNAA